MKKDEAKNSTPELTGWLYVRECPDFAGDCIKRRLEAVTAVGMKTVAFNKPGVALDWRKNGELCDLDGQKDRGWGYDTTQRIFDLTDHNTVIKSCRDSDLDIGSINTVDAMASAWENDDFSRQLPPP